MIEISIHAPRVGRDSGKLHFFALYIIFQSTRPVWGATASSRSRSPCPHWISIHAPRVGRDPLRGCCAWRIGHFNPRAPCGARRARLGSRSCRAKNFNPRAPCGARPGAYILDTDHKHFNPRAPCGARLCRPYECDDCNAFQSTRPVWGATVHRVRRLHRHCHFNPRAPCGARLP